MNATTPRAVGLLLLTVMIPMAAGPAAAYIGQELAGDAKITIDQARAIALKAPHVESQTKNSNAKMAEADFATRSASMAVRTPKNSAWTPQRAKCSRTAPTEKSSIRRSRPPRRERRFPYGWSNHVRRRKKRIEQGS